MATLPRTNQDCLVRNGCEMADVGALFEVHHDRIYRYILRINRYIGRRKEYVTNADAAGKKPSGRRCAHRRPMKGEPFR
jgi:hypothetical protein